MMIMLQLEVTSTSNFLLSFSFMENRKANYRLLLIFNLTCDLCMSGTNGTPEIPTTVQYWLATVTLLW